MKTVVFLFISMFLITSCSQQSEQKEETVAEEKNEIVIGELLSIHSEILQEERPFFIHLPESYDDQDYTPKKYPVLYLLDGGTHFHSASGVMNFMSAGFNGNMQIPEMIIVAIPNTRRVRDLSHIPLTLDYEGENVEEPYGGGGDNFLKFIETELIPKIEQDYRTLPHRTLVGHSLGGLIALYSFIENPELFNGYIAIDPSIWWESGELLKRGQEKLPTYQNLKARIFISMADHNPEEAMLKNIVAFTELMEEMETADLQTDSFLYKGEDHGSVPLISLYNGLLHVFEGYKPDNDDFFEDIEKTSNHFKDFSKKMGIEFLLPEKVVDIIGDYMASPDGEIENALDYYIINTKNYPTSSHAFEKLAKHYSDLGKIDLARENYKKAIDLDGNNEAAIKALNELD